MTAFANPAALLTAVGAELGTTEWLEIDQHRIDGFAAATGDEQWIHVDPQRAAAGPFGGTIAHGYLSLSLLAPFTAQLLEVGSVAMAINYGLDRVRFLQPVRSGSRLRARGSITSAEAVGLGVRVGVKMTVEIDGESKPALVADTIVLFAAEPHPTPPAEEPS
ncbi:MaoC family dehydratase [Glaciihabitans sp. INWT7]|uniref:MaoC family dehydratase n=1 Tax=Glaciihabitans sp. INWT7 TaxID=2596912 RepID=UPI001626D424|nr:MaoC family dehydratase [Glaciihabitans sp. INWT7]QNE47101.1 MaoC family dehydratase [Glaciihabitans sp. INWT7]